jgi:hypothetical protein
VIHSAAELTQLHVVLALPEPAERGPRPPARTLLPALLVILLAVLGPTLDRTDSCASTDGPQFRCWLDSAAVGIARRGYRADS